MLTPFFTTHFKKDIKKINKSGNKNINKLTTIVKKLINEKKIRATI